MHFEILSCIMQKAEQEKQCTKKEVIKYKSMTASDAPGSAPSATYGSLQQWRANSVQSSSLHFFMPIRTRHPGTDSTLHR